MAGILLFEKNVFMRDVLRRVLQGRFAGLDVREVASFEECLSALRDWNPDILLLDLSYHSGTDMKQLLQIRQGDPSTVIMLLMEYDIDEYRREAIRNGADYIISRDLWTGREIITLIQKLLTDGRKQSEVQVESVAGTEDIPARLAEHERKGLSGKKLFRNS